MIMNKNRLVSIIAPLSVLLLGWGTPESSKEEAMRPSVNFSGTIETHQDEKLVVENITINRRFRQIALYDTPVKHNNPVKNEKTGLMEIKMDQDPKTYYTVTKIDLEETSEFRVNPEPIWYYQESPKSRKSSFVEIIVISNDSKKTKNSYLISENDKIFCDGINEAGPLEKVIPIVAVKKLIITGRPEPIAESEQSQKNSDINRSQKKTNGRQRRKKTKVE